MKTAAEIYALSQTVKDARHARWVANEMGVNTTSCVQVEVDNNQAISFQRGTCPSTKLKGVYDLRWNWVQEIRRDGEVKCVSVNTKHNCADLLTKCLKREDVADQRFLNQTKIRVLKVNHWYYSFNCSY